MNKKVKPLAPQFNYTNPFNIEATVNLTSILLTLLLLIIAFCGGWLTAYFIKLNDTKIPAYLQLQNHNNTSLTEAVKTEIPGQIPGAWVRYVNKEHHFSLLFPPTTSDVRLLNYPPVLTDYTKNQVPNVMLRVQLKLVPENFNKEQELKHKLLLTSENQTIASREAYKYEYLVTEGFHEVHFLVPITSSDYLIMSYLYHPVKTTEAEKSELSTIINTLQFEHQTL